MVWSGSASLRNSVKFYEVQKLIENKNFIELSKNMSKVWALKFYTKVGPLIQSIVNMWVNVTIEAMYKNKIDIK